MKKYSTGVPSTDMMLTLCFVKIFHLLVLEKLKLGHAHGQCGDFRSFVSQLSGIKYAINAATFYKSL